VKEHDTICYIVLHLVKEMFDFLFHQLSKRKEIDH